MFESLNKYVQGYRVHQFINTNFLIDCIKLRVLYLAPHQLQGIMALGSVFCMTQRNLFVWYRDGFRFEMKKMGTDLNITHTYICMSVFSLWHTFINHIVISINFHRMQHVLLFQLKNVRCNFGDKYFFDVSRFRLNIPL